ncbi:MAG: class I SAM-dependent methyltransferase [Isosphaeraceae bacterium]
MTDKSTVDEIRARFDADVERFSNLETGQSATVDAPLVLELITEAAAACNPGAKSVLDVGCGAGNYAIKLLRRLPGLDVTLIDLSRPMLDRARERISAESAGSIEAIQGDIRDIDLPEAGFDIILAAMVLHHLRGEAEWEAVFGKLHRALRPGGTLWIADHITHEIPAVDALMMARWGDYLVGFKGEAYRDQVFAYTRKEDTPRPLTFQLEMLRRAGFRPVEVLHKTSCFAAFGAVR